MWKNRVEFHTALKDAAKNVGIVITAPLLKTGYNRARRTGPTPPTRAWMRRATRSRTRRCVTPRPCRGGEDVDEYVQREVLPYAPDAWIDHAKTKEGAEIPFTRHFYHYVPPRSLEEIDRDARCRHGPTPRDARRGGAVMQGPWAGDVPNGWQIRPLWSEFRRGKKLGDGTEELLSVYRDYGVVPKSSRDDNFNTSSEDLSKYQRVSVGDLVVNKMKAWQGSLGISNHDESSALRTSYIGPPVGSIGGSLIICSGARSMRTTWPRSRRELGRTSGISIPHSLP